MKANELRKFISNYIISKDGKIFSKKRNKILKQDIFSGYANVVLSNNGNKIKIGVHRLVAFIYKQNLYNKPCVNHLDGNKLNNNVENLEWCTYSENEIHSRYVLGKKIKHFPETKKKMRDAAKGRDMSKLINKSVITRRGKKAHNTRSVILNEKLKFNSITEASLKMGVSIGSISNNLSGLSQLTKIGKWEYA
jgi:hypothetical protein